MKFYRYWAKDTVQLSIDDNTFTHDVWGWSNESVEDAKLVAQRRADSIDTEKWRDVNRNDWTYYPNIPIREETLPTGQFDFDEVQAVTSINTYGAFVLNVSTLPILDIDFKPVRKPASPFIKLLGKLLRFNTERNTLTYEEQTAAVISKCERLTESQPELGLRLYRTKFGLRLFITSHTFSPTTEFIQNLFQFFEVDPLYRLLCKNQESYRARLSPKPFNIGLQSPRKKFPQSKDEQVYFQNWQKDYLRTSEQFSVCKHIKDFGYSTWLPAFNQIITYHDEMCRVAVAKELA